jgi:long-chain acyl-CoA synthetase
VVRRAFEEACRCRVEQGYGLSETAAVATGYADEEPYRSGSAGQPAPGVRVSILGANGQPQPPRGIGEICLAGDHIMAGYWQDPASTAEAFTSEWFRTGDIGYLDEDGYLFITDRKKELIIKGGENISPREIEEALYRHPAVLDAAVVPMSDPLFGEEICAVLQLKPGASATEDEIRSHVTPYVGKFKTPARVVVHPALPRNATGKISKRDIREQLPGLLSNAV